MSDERPIGLAELAEVDAPEVVSAALGRFRRRMLVRAVLIPAVVTAIIFLPRLLPEGTHSYQRQFTESRLVHAIGERLLSGAVDVVVLEARRVDERGGDWVGVRFVVTTDELKGQERLSVGEAILGTMESCMPEVPSGPEPSAPITVFSSSFNPTEPDVADVVLRCPVGTRRAQVKIGAYYNAADQFVPSVSRPPNASYPKGPGTHTQEECAVPLNPLGVCALTKAEGSYRPLATITIDLADLGVPMEIWRTP